MAGMTFDRREQDLGNILLLEHVNVRVPDQHAATLFYIAGLGLTRDPYLMTSVTNMWVNLGRSQFHLPTGTPQVLRGHAGIVVPDLGALARRLAAVAKRLDSTRFAFREHNAFIDVTSPWGNRLRCYGPEDRFGRINLGIPYVEFDVPPKTAAGIARFYRETLDTPAEALDDGEAKTRLLRKLTAHVEVSCEVFAKDFKLPLRVVLKPRPRFPGISFCDHYPPRLLTRNETREPRPSLTAAFGLSSQTCLFGLFGYSAATS